MLINEKALLRAMKEKYKTSGYHVAVVDGKDQPKMILIGGTWAVLIKANAAPRKILGYIAETVGTLPDPGQAYRVRKDLTEREQLEFVTGPIDKMEDLFAEDPRWRIKPTELTMGGNELWQNCGTMGMILMDPALTDIIGDSRAEVYMVGDLLSTQDTESVVYLTRVRPTEESDKYLEHLSKALWVAVT